jgi:hypothetical protein
MKEQLLLIFNKVVSNGFLLLLIIAVLYILFLRECKKPPPCPAQDEMIIKKSDWNNLVALADKPPVVRVDTFWKKGEIIYINSPLPPSKPQKDTTINKYEDSLVNDSIDVQYKFFVRGKLIGRTWQYKPITTVITIDSLIYVPKVVEIEKRIEVLKNGLYAYGIAGGNATSFLFGGGLDFITKKDTEIGYLYQRFGSQGFHSVKLGARIFNKK